MTRAQRAAAAAPSTGSWTSSKKGPMVVNYRPGLSADALIDWWERPLTDVGLPGADRATNARTNWIPFRSGNPRLPSASAKLAVLKFREPYRQNLLRAHPAVAVFFHQHELLGIGQPGRNHHFSTSSQLMDQRRRNEVRSSCHNYLVERSV